MSLNPAWALVVSILAWPIITGLWRIFGRRFDSNIDRNLALAYAVSTDERAERATYFAEQRLLQDRNMYLGLAYLIWWSDLSMHATWTIVGRVAAGTFYCVALGKGARALTLRHMLEGKASKVSAAEIERLRPFMPRDR